MKAILAIAVAGVVVFGLVSGWSADKEIIRRPQAWSGHGFTIPYEYRIQQGLQQLKSLPSATRRFTKREILEELDALKNIGSIVRSAPDTLDVHAKATLSELKTQLVSVQINDYPVLRKHYTKDLSDKLFIADATATCSGRNNNEITFEGSTFAFPTNVQYLHEHEVDVLRRLHFRRANYEWGMRSHRAANYILETDSDSVLPGSR